MDDGGSAGAASKPPRGSSAPGWVIDAWRTGRVSWRARLIAVALATILAVLTKAFAAARGLPLPYQFALTTAAGVGVLAGLLALAWTVAQRLVRPTQIQPSPRPKPQLEPAWANPRSTVARRYIRGSGLEIGAAHKPLRLPAGTSVQYVDWVPLEELKRLWPEVANLPLVNIDIVDDGETLATVPPNSQDFIIANHFLEHCLDPIGTIMNLHSKLRDQGILYFAIPEKRHTFDRPRPVTAYEHLLDEYHDGGKQSFRGEHTREVAQFRVKDPDEVERWVEDRMNSGYRIHYHAWTYNEILELFTRTIREFNLDLEPECFIVNGQEVISVLRKTAPPE